MEIIDYYYKNDENVTVVIKFSNGELSTISRNAYLDEYNRIAYKYYTVTPSGDETCIANIISEDLKQIIADVATWGIKIKKIIPQTVEAFNPKGESMGFINEYEFNDLRIQIKNANVEGYYMVFEGRNIPIEKDGNVDEWGKMYELYGNQLDIL